MICLGTALRGQSPGLAGREQESTDTNSIQLGVLCGAAFCCVLLNLGSLNLVWEEISGVSKMELWVEDKRPLISRAYLNTSLLIAGE